MFKGNIVTNFIIACFVRDFIDTFQSFQVITPGYNHPTASPG